MIHNLTRNLDDKEINVQTCNHYLLTDWISVAKLHLTKSGKGKLRECGDLRRYFNVKLCNSNCKNLLSDNSCGAETLYCKKRAQGVIAAIITAIKRKRTPDKDGLTEGDKSYHK